MGAVWRATHRSGVQVALKIIAPHLGSDHGGLDTIAGLRAEIRAIAALEHPNIVPVFDAGVLGPEHEAMSGGNLIAGSPWLAMELAHGSIRDLNVGLDWFDWAGILLQVLDGLAHAHARGLVHRDLKPENVLFTRSGNRLRILVADFGLAWALRGAAQPQDGGTVAYAAPEQLLAQTTEQGPWTDLYALGCTAFWMITGRKPFRGATVEDLRRAHLFTDIPRLRSRVPTPPELEAWIHGLMAKDPRRRYQRAADAAYALLRLPEPLANDIDEEDDIDTVTTFNGEKTRTQTLPIDSWSHSGRAAPTTALNAAEFRPPVPNRWVRPTNKAPRVSGRGLGLFGMGVPPVVGRVSERDQLWHSLANTDRMVLATLEGPAGVGKTRLGGWLGERAHEVGAAEVFRATFTNTPSQTSGLAAMVQEHLLTHGMGGQELLRHLQTALKADGFEDDNTAFVLARLLRPEDPSLGATAVGLDERIDVVWRLMSQRANGRRLVVFLDDVHLSSDPGALLIHMARHAKDVPGLLVVSLGEAIPGPLAQQIALAERVLSRVSIPLGPLSSPETRELVKAMVPVPDRLAQSIAKTTQGNPRDTVQLVTDLVQRGQLRGDATGMVVDPAVPLPESLASLWEGALERVGALDDIGRKALEIASLLGNTLSLPEWRDACDRMGVMLDAHHLARVEKLGFIGPDRGGSHYSFSNGFVRDALVESLTREERAQGIHLAIGAALEARGDARAAACGEHLEAAGEPGRAAAAYLRAMRWLAEWDRERALELGSRWYATLGREASEGDPRWASGMQVLVELLGVQGGDAHRRATEELLERGKGDPTAESRALIELCRGDLRALALPRAHARAELAWRRSVHTPLRMAAAGARAQVRQAQGDLELAKELLEDALRADPVLPSLNLGLASVLCDLGDPDGAYDRVMAWSDSLPGTLAPLARARIHRARGEALIGSGRTREAVAAMKEACQLRDQAGFHWPELEVGLGAALVENGHVLDGAALLRQILPELHVERDARMRAQALAILALVSSRRKNWSQVEECLDALEDLPLRGRWLATGKRLKRVAVLCDTAAEVALGRRARTQVGPLP